MAAITWPKKGTASLLGTRQDRIDGIEKATGTAKYSYDITPEKTLIARVLGCPHGSAEIKSIDLSAAKRVPGVVAVYPLKRAPDVEPLLAPTKSDHLCEWEGDLVAVVAGETEGAVAEGLKAIKIEYEKLDHFVKEEDLAAAQKAGRAKPGGDRQQIARRSG